MSDIVAGALVTIEPDFTGFEEKLTRALKDAVTKAQKSATVSLNIEGTGGAATGEMKAFSASLEEVNKSLKEIANNTRKTSQEIKGGFISNVTSAIAQTAVFASSISNLVKNTQDIIGFGAGLGRFFSLFKEGSASAEGFSGKMKNVGKSIVEAFVPFEDQDSVTKNFGSTITNVAKTTDNLTEKLSNIGKGSKKAGEEVKDAGKNIKEGLGDEAGSISFGQILADFGNLPKRLASVFRKGTPEVNTALREVLSPTVTADKASAAAETASQGIVSRIIGVFRRGKPQAAAAFQDVLSANVTADKASAAAETASQGIVSRIIGTFRRGKPQAAAAFQDVLSADVKADRASASAEAASQGIVSRIIGTFRKAVPQSAEAGESVKKSFIDRIRTLPTSFGDILTSIRAFFTNVGNAASGLGTLGQGILAVSKVGGVAGNAIQSLGNTVKGGVARFAEMSGAGKALTGVIGGGLAAGAALGVAAAAKLAAKLGELVQRGIQSAAEMERLKIALKGVFQFTEKETTAAFKSINEFAAKTPFSLQSSTNAIIKLRSAFKNLDLQGATAVLADIAGAAAAAGASEEAVGRATLAIQQIGAKGRLSAEEMNQFTEALPNISRTAVFEILAKQLGKTTEQVQRLADAGKIGSTQGINALLEAARQAPGAATALEDQAGTFQGALSTVKDLFNQLLATSFTPLLKQITGILQAAEGSFAQVAPVMENFGKLVAAAFQSLAPVLKDLVISGAGLLSVLLPIVTIGVQLISLFLQPFIKFTSTLNAVLGAVLFPILLKVSQGLAIVSSWVDKVGRFFQILAQKQLKGLVPVLQNVGKFFTQLKDRVVEVATNIGTALRPVLNFLLDVGQKVVALFATPLVLALVAVGAVIVKVIIPVLGVLLKVIIEVGKFIGNLAITVKDVLVSAFNAAMPTIKAVAGFFTDMFNRARDLAGTLTTALGPAIDFIAKAFSTVGTAITKALKFLSKLPGVSSTLKNVSAAAKEAFGPGSPLEKLDLPDGNIEDLKVKLIDLDREMGDLINTSEGFPKVFQALAAGAVTAFQGGADTINRFKNTLIQAADLLLQPLDPFKAALDSAKSAKDARKQLAGIDSQINDLTGQRNTLVQKRRDLEGDTARKIREQEDSLAAIAQIERDIVDLGQEREQILFDEQRRQEDFAPTLAALEDQTLSANINLARAKRDVEAAQKAINEAVEAGIPKEEFNLNLAGLSLDQIRVKLAQTRATLSAQKAGLKTEEKGTEETKSKEELQEDLLLAQIGVRDAEREIVDLGQSRVDLIREADIAQREFGERIVALGVQERQLNNAKSDALAEHQRLLRGEIGIQAEIRDITRDIADINRQIADTSAQRAAAALQVRDAELAAAEAAARARGDASAVLAIRQEQFRVQQGQVSLDQATTAELQKQLDILRNSAGQVNTIATGFAGLQTGQLVINPTTGIPGLAPGASDPLGKLAAGAQAIIDSVPGLRSGFDEINRLNDYFNSTGGIAGRADGDIVNTRTLSWIGEAGREAVLPLTRPNRMQALLADSSVWAPIMQAMPKRATMSVIPAISDIVAPSMGVRSGPTFGTMSPRSGVATMSRQQKKNEMRELAEAIAAAMKDAGAMEPRTVEVHAPTTIQTPANPQVNERAIVNRIMKQLEGRL